MSEQAEVQFHVGMVRYMLDDEAGARTALQEAASSTENFSGKEEAARRLAILSMDVAAADATGQGRFGKEIAGRSTMILSLPPVWGQFMNATAPWTRPPRPTSNHSNKIPKTLRLCRGSRVFISILNQPDKAMEVAKDAHKFAPEDTVITCMLGRLAFQSGDYTWAANLLQDAAPRLPNRPDVQYDLAWSYYTVGRVSNT